MESVHDDCLAQFSSKYVLKEERRQAVLGLLEQEYVVAVLNTTGFGKILIYQLFVAVKLKQREKNVVLVASPLRILSMIKLKHMVLIKENRAQVLLTLLLQGKQTLLDLSSVCETVKPRSL